mmetsp:Transcript_22746/g.69913  ORF Transcript_22746/g.69913 Transcript_22746/m.69913 type:complete len:131 (-) Transcript_22746:55-447(-)|eukprot:CAMPEP_0198657152 /NCGR_PEP_ID=MMETSP1467-20131203/11330_1 /TAXON_ID=1462469 /ORGANISM="unid. sp., Strain CCMP2135" /LENGTH=130 /DNA_ID=CAMNT_0044393253 /DNA_START=159 /DNA_END=551 /DNA_ORIENTATION=+
MAFWAQRCAALRDARDRGRPSAWTRCVLGRVGERLRPVQSASPQWLLLVRIGRFDSTPQLGTATTTYDCSAARPAAVDKRRSRFVRGESLAHRGINASAPAQQQLTSENFLLCSSALLVRSQLALPIRRV